MTWRVVTLAQVAAADGGLIQTGPFGSQLHEADYTDEGTPVVMPRDISEGSINSFSVARVADETAQRLSRHMLAERTLVLPRRGDIAKRALIGPEQAGWLCGTGCVQIRLSGKMLAPEFLYYFMELPYVTQWLTQNAVGTTMLNLSARIIGGLPVRLPTVGVQTRIARILSTYDALIENNRRRMVLLEDAARHLYREWFVRLRFPGQEHSRTVEGKRHGWERRTLKECASFSSGGTPSKARSEYWEGEIPWVSSGELTSMRIGDASLKISAEAAQAGSRLVPRETVLAVVRGMSLAKEWRLGITSREVAFNQDLKALTAHAGLDPLFLFHSLEVQRDQVRDRAGEASHGTKKLESAVLSSIPILVPPPFLQQLFRDHVGPMHDQWDNLSRQVVKLRAARDLLLPRLMSGEIGV